MGVQTKNTERLSALLQPHAQSINVLQEALKEITEEQAEAKKDKAKGLLRQALDLQKQMDDAERTFTGQKKKFDKSLGKLMNQLSNMARGGPTQPEEPEDDDKEDKDKDKEEDEADGEG